VELTRLSVFQFRNFDRQEIRFSAGTNLFIGRNGQGKTNLLEAIYLLGYGRSFRTSLPRDCIQHGQKDAAVEGTVQRGGLTRDLKVLISAAEKKVLLHGKQVDLDEFAGNIHILAFTQEHMKVVRGGPGERRAFLDRAMILLFPGHMRYLSSYSRALKQRNRILSEAYESGRSLDEAFLESWQEALIQNGVRILVNRMRYVDQIKEQLPAGLFGSDTLKMHYVSTVPANADSEELESEFRRRLQNARNLDQKTGYTTVGPHRDDLKLFVNGKSVIDFGSAGQQRSALLSLYFAQMEIHRNAHGFYPVFLMDDAEAELDEVRLKTFLRYLEQRTQTFLTTAKESFFPPLVGSGLASFRIDGGKVS
jgi:DNA replication and repair protein RecF